MQRETTTMPARDLEHIPFDARPLQLDVHGRAVTDSGEHVGEPRHSRAPTEIQRGENRPGGVRHRSPRNGKIVEYDNLAIRRAMDVELQGIRAMLEREKKAFQRVFTPLPRRTAMGDALNAGCGAEGGFEGGFSQTFKPLKR